MKVNKNIHVMILLTFALVFVVVYLYYTINDVKKLGTDLKKNTQDIQNVATSLNNLNKVVNELKVSSAVSVKEVCASPASAKEAEPKAEPDAKEDEEEDELAEEDMKKLLNEIPSSDDEEEEEEKGEPSNLDVEELKKMKLDDLKALCKERDLSAKGTKDQLVGRLTA